MGWLSKVGGALAGGGLGGLVMGPLGKIGGALAGSGALSNFGIPGFPSLTKDDEVNPESTLTPEQQQQLAALTQQNISGYGDLFGQLQGMAQNPQNDYKRMVNWEGEFNQGVVNPALNQMNQLIGDTKHSSNLHSSANRYAQDRVKQDTMDKLSGLRYNQMMTERGMEMSGQEQARQRQLAALTGLSNLSGQGVGVQGIENVVTPGTPGLVQQLVPLAGSAAIASLFSDKTVKRNIKNIDINKCSEIVKAIPLHSYKYTDEVKEYTNTEVPCMGWMAQDIEKVLPEAVAKVQLGDREVLTIRPDMIYATMFGAMQKLLKDNEELKSRLDKLDGGI